MNEKTEELEKLAKKLQAEYVKSWRKKNPDKFKQTLKNYWIKKAKKYQEIQEKEE